MELLADTLMDVDLGLVKEQDDFTSVNLWLLIYWLIASGGEDV